MHNFGGQCRICMFGQAFFLASQVEWSQQYDVAAKKVNVLQECISSSIGFRSHEIPVIVLLCSSQMSLGTLHPILGTMF